tara:strand:+ start:278 stop:544 length:267 start_codon:yes stop_codon:yes gene_type:complete
MKYKNVEIISTKYNKEGRHLSYDVTYRVYGNDEVVTKPTYPNASFVYGVGWNGMGKDTTAKVAINSDGYIEDMKDVFTKTVSGYIRLA